jgi:hypothetical protein
MICPSCGLKVSPTYLCPRCGDIIAHFSDRKFTNSLKHAKVVRPVREPDILDQLGLGQYRPFVENKHLGLSIKMNRVSQ